LPALPVVLSEWTDNPDNVHNECLHNTSGLVVLSMNSPKRQGKPSERGILKPNSTTNGNALAMDVSDGIMINFDKRIESTGKSTSLT
jgi:hypothetical protein